MKRIEDLDKPISRQLEAIMKISEKIL